MTKIKKIKIDDFRIYNGSQEFSFETGKELANLMVIYAPNGYGKTSFFDAVEWCYTSKIRRFESLVLSSEIKGKDFSSGDKILLTNRTSFKDGRHGMVEICTSEEKILKRTSTERKGVNVDYRYDYLTKSDQELGEFDPDVLNRLVKTNILTQDQIDEFLRHTKPDERFVQLSQFWPEGQNALSILEKIDSYYRSLENERADIKRRIGDYQKELKNLLNEGKNIDKLNKIIEDLTNNSKSGFNVQPLNANVNQETYEVILTTTQTFVERLKIIIDGTSLQITRLSELHKQLDSFLQAEKDFDSAEKELSQLTELSRAYSDFNLYKKTLKEIESSATSAKSIIESYNRLSELFDHVKGIYARSDEQLKIMEATRLIIDDLYKRQKNYRVSDAKFNSILREWHENITLKESQISIWDSEVEKYNFWNGERSRIEKILKEKKNLLKGNILKIDDNLAKRRVLNAIIENGKFETLPDGVQQNISEVLDARSEKIALIASTKESIIKFQAELENANSLAEIFDKIVTWGEDLVSRTDVNHCPLCATDFKNTSTLLAQIKKQKAVESRGKNLKTDLDDLIAKQKDYDTEIADFNKQIINHIKDQIILLEEDLLSLQEERDDYTSEISNLESSLEHANNSSTNSINALNLQNHMALEGVVTEFNQNKSDLEKNLADIKLKYLRLENIQKYIQHRISSIDNEIGILRNKISTSQNLIDIALSDRLVIEAEKILNHVSLTKEDFSKGNISSHTLIKHEELDSIVAKKEEITGFIDQLNVKLKQFTTQIPEEEIEGLRIQTEQVLIANNRKITEYKTSLAMFSDDAQPTADFFVAKLIEKNDDLEGIKNELKALESLVVDLKVIEKNVRKNHLEDEIERLDKELPSIDIAFEEVEKARAAAKGYINNEINNHFSQDVINQIYSRIEPHPNLNHIMINPKITDKGMPVIDIKAVSNNEELHPSLYLSAGQLNVLSLSIFLAKAFESRNDEIETIFMDDPIQNLSDINVLSFIDLIRTMTTKYDRQIVISSHDENFFNLIRNKMPTEEYNVRYYQIESFGKAKILI
ncbi:AAA family ATPase [Flavobacterium beibuense]|uniref:SMC domain protein n=1 Tax=Flavobacterium beibuense TaxID=657326 RepID=A0A444WEJ9_9FLAO|nr:AAA family ATPase [Flavobacterium beibuense]RYJ44280.1 SMC domain protein [Flavobacterium beibuense]